ncbi:MAG: GntR family transcriptional regulator [Bryobacteraceae bacterium]
MNVETTAASLAERLRLDIDAGVWAPGSALRQEELATRYGASRIPVREALQLLRADGLLEIEPNRGAYVRALNASEIDEIFDLRVLLEGYLLAIATPLHTTRTLVRLHSIQAELEVEDSRMGWLLGDRRFHQALYEPAGRIRSLEIVMMLRRQVERYALHDVNPGTRRTEWKREHRSLINAVKARDASRAAVLLTHHLNETRTVIFRHLPLPEA